MRTRTGGRSRAQVLWILGLSLLLAAQLAFWSQAAASGPGPVTLDEPVTAIDAVSEDGPAELVLENEADRWTLLLAFRSTCGHCERVAPDWARWLQASDEPGLRTVAVTNEAWEVGRAYADGHGWAVDVSSLPDQTQGSWARGLTSRTPWLFLFDPTGTLRYNDHGATLDEVTSLFRDLAAVH